MKLLLSWVLSAASLAVAAWFLGEHMNIGTPEQTAQQKLIPLAVVAAVFSLVNAFIGPVVKVLSLPFIVITLGLFLLIINAVLLLLTEWFTAKFPMDGVVPFSIDGFWWAVAGSIVISLVNAILGSVAKRA
jgi:putative membrane protein